MIYLGGKQLLTSQISQTFPTFKIFAAVEINGMPQPDSLMPVGLNSGLKLWIELEMTFWKFSFYKFRNAQT